MVNVKGQVVYDMKHKFTANKLELNSTGFPDGVYVLHITGKYGIDAKVRVVIAK